MKGRGAPRLKGGGKGDLLARLRLDGPAEALEGRSSKLLEELRKVGG